jgi:hypothetical protein
LGACAAKTGAAYQCWRTNQRTRVSAVDFVPPYPSAIEDLPAVQAEVGTRFERDTVWLEAAAVRDGAARHLAWTQDAAAGRVYDCAGLTCKTIVRGTLRLKTGRQLGPPETAIAQCDVAVIRGTRGAPSRCQPLAVVHDGSLLLSATASLVRPPGRRLTPPRYDLYVTNTRMTAAQMTMAVNRALAAAPLSFETDIEQNAVIGNATFRVSPIDARFHETATITAIVTGPDRSFEDRDFTADSYAVRFVTSFYVSPQNSERHEDLTYPPDTYQAAYAAAFKKGIFAQLGAGCAGSWRDAEVIACR